ncbi:hypothetical protein OUZ56_022774 [Daphnia magna]|uniref:Uncharacterized protein n=1 Tax=Daphnia magna TaxID=35525 RepID=A0ABR0AXG4_9CRUS|nr:hypothetical protein OUZ56_022774 [Daphnia magna]
MVEWQGRSCPLLFLTRALIEVLVSRRNHQMVENTTQSSVCERDAAIVAVTQQKREKKNAPCGRIRPEDLTSEQHFRLHDVILSKTCASTENEGGKKRESDDGIHEFNASAPKEKRMKAGRWKRQMEPSSSKWKGRYPWQPASPDG